MRKSHFTTYTWALMFMLVVLSCGKDKEGCTEQAALNFDPEATIEDGSCEFSLEYIYGLEFGSMTDQEGNQYATIVIGNQEWMAENLRTTKYCNGDPLANVTDSSQWVNLTSGAWAHYQNNSQYEVPYGKLYNWYAVDDSRNICPCGWHVPSDAEWDVLIDLLGVNAGGKMKSTGTEYWNHPNANATNESGFSGLPGGLRHSNGAFYDIGYVGFWWSSTEFSVLSAGNQTTSYYSGDVSGEHLGKTFGFSVRCLRD